MAQHYARVTTERNAALADRDRWLGHVRQVQAALLQLSLVGEEGVERLPCWCFQGTADLDASSHTEDCTAARGVYQAARRDLEQHDGRGK